MSDEKSKNKQNEGGDSIQKNNTESSFNLIGTPVVVAILFVLFAVLFSACDSGEKERTGEQTAEPSGQKETEDAMSHADLSEGKTIYTRYCQSCHGVDGKGAGPAAEYLFPRPRDFTTGTYKFTSTPYGELPAKGDLQRTVKKGLQGTGMPGFESLLTDSQVENVVAYVKQFSPRFKDQKLPESVPVSDPPPASDELVKHGREVYMQNACWTCHGKQGEGDGPSAGAQADSWGNPVPPRDLTKGTFKVGEDPGWIYRVTMTGVTGTGMAGYLDTIKNERDRWALVRYVMSLGEQPEGLSRMMSMMQKKSLDVKQGTIPGSPWDSAWEEVSGTRLNVFPLWKRPEAAPDVNVAAVHNGKELAVLVEWRDPSKNMQDLQHRSFSDAVALQYPVSGNGPPFVGMGDNQESGLVRMWHWKAVRQAGAEKGSPMDLEDVYRDMFADRYPWLEPQKPGEFLNMQKGDSNIAKQNKKYQSAVDVGNPLSDPSLAGKTTLEYVAKGFGTLAAVPREQMTVSGRGEWKEGIWRVVFRRPLEVNSDQDRNFSAGDSVYFGFAIFDGKFMERNGKKSISQWIQFNLK